MLNFIYFLVERIVGVRGNNSMPITGPTPVCVRVTQQGLDNRTINSEDSRTHAPPGSWVRYSHSQNPGFLN